MTKRILAFGNPVYDVISTPQILRKERVLSGCSTNACLAAAKMGINSTLVGAVGPDFREKLAQDLIARGIDYLFTPSHETGGFSLIYYDAYGNRELTLLGVADAIPASVKGFSAHDFVLIGPILGEVGVELVKNIQAQSSSPILTDPQGLLRGQVDGRITHALTRDFEQIAALSLVVKANELETRVVTGIDPRKDPEAAVKALYKFGCKIAVTTIAEAGSIIYDGKNLYTIPPFKTNAIDPTGAGDTYAAGFITKYMETPGDLTAVGCFASAVASVMVENSGPDFPLTRAEADRRQKILLQSPKKLEL